jgi:DNA-directed RNA polymerase subunit RPC12/RpoP
VEAEVTKTICVKCNKQAEVIQSGVTAVEMAEFGPYKLWGADLHRCPKCGYEFVSGFAHVAYAEHFQDGFEGMMQKAIDANNAYYF